MSFYKAVSCLSKEETRTFLKHHGVTYDTDDSEDGKSELDEEYHANKPPPISNNQLFANLASSNGFDTAKNNFKAKLNNKTRATFKGLKSSSPPKAIKRCKKGEKYKKETIKTSVEEKIISVDHNLKGFSSKDKRRSNKEQRYNTSNIKNIKNNGNAKSRCKTKLMNRMHRAGNNSYEMPQQEENDQYYAVENAEEEFMYYHQPDYILTDLLPKKSLRRRRKRRHKKSSTRDTKNNWFVEERQRNFDIDNFPTELNYGMHAATNTFETIDSYEMLQQEEFGGYFIDEDGEEEFINHVIDYYSINSWRSNKERRGTGKRFIKERQRNYGDLNYGMHTAVNTYETINSYNMLQHEEYGYYSINSWRSNKERRGTGKRFVKERQRNYGDLNYGMHTAVNTYETINSYNMLQHEEYGEYFVGEDVKEEFMNHVVDYYEYESVGSYSNNSWRSSDETQSLSTFSKILLVTILCVCIYLWINVDQPMNLNSYLSMF